MYVSRTWDDLRDRRWMQSATVHSMLFFESVDLVLTYFERERFLMLEIVFFFFQKFCIFFRISEWITI